MTLSDVVAGAGSVVLALGVAVARAGPGSPPVKVDFIGTCESGLIVWKQVGPNAPKCGYQQIPQVKIFDAGGKLRFAGSALDAIRWAKAGQPVTPIPEGIRVRDAASEARITHVAAPSAGHGWVTYYGWSNCPPCETQLVAFRAEVMTRLGPSTSLTVFDPS